MSSIALKLEHRRAIAKQGEALYPQECRGLLLGRRSGMNVEVVDLMIIHETATPESEGYRYHIPSAKMREGEEMAKAKGLEVIGSFHSHVDQPARPLSMIAISSSRPLVMCSSAYGRGALTS